jgi:hypothetical protein
MVFGSSTFFPLSIREKEAKTKEYLKDTLGQSCAKLRLS